MTGVPRKPKPPWPEPQEDLDGPDLPWLLLWLAILLLMVGLAVGVTWLIERPT